MTCSNQFNVTSAWYYHARSWCIDSLEANSSDHVHQQIKSSKNAYADAKVGLPDNWWNLGFHFVVARLDNFLVKLSNQQPTLGVAIPSNFTLCAQYDGGVAAGGTASVSCPVDLQRFRYVVIESPKTTVSAICLVEVRVYGIFLNGLFLVYEHNLRQTALFYLLEDYKVLIVTNWFELCFDPSASCSKLEVQPSHNVRTLPS
jgi:hypothetical protein